MTLLKNLWQGEQGQDLNAALKFNPGCHQAQIWRGLILFHLGLYVEASQGLEEALAVHPADTRTLVFLGHTALYQGHYEEADDFITRALRVDPASIWPNLFFPLVPLYQGRLAEAMEKLRVARQMLPEEPTLVSVGGLIAAHEGDSKKAEQLAGEALENPRTMLHTHHLWHNVAAVYAMCGKPGKAVHWLGQRLGRCSPALGSPAPPAATPSPSRPPAPVRCRMRF